MGRKSKGRGKAGRGRGAPSDSKAVEPVRPGASNAVKSQGHQQPTPLIPQETPLQQTQSQQHQPPQQQHSTKQEVYPSLPQQQTQQTQSMQSRQQQPTQSAQQESTAPEEYPSLPKQQITPQTTPLEQKKKRAGSQASKGGTASVHEITDQLQSTILQDNKELAEAGLRYGGQHKTQGQQGKPHPGVDLVTGAHTGGASKASDVQRQHPSNQGASASGSGARPKQQKNNKQVIASAMSEEKPHQLKKQDLPRRPGYGNVGRPIKLKANFFKLDFRSVDYIYHYDIDIKPDKTPVAECREVVKAAVEKFLKSTFDNHYPAFDGKKNLYSRKKLPSVNGQGVVLDVKLPGKDGGKDRHFKLTVKYAAEVRVEDLNQFLSGEGKAVPEAVQALDIVLRQIPSFNFTPVGRSFFPQDMRGVPLGGGCEMRTGFYQSVRPSEWKTMLVNIDVSSKGFMKAQPVIDFLCEILKDADPRRFDERQISNRQWRMNRFQEKEFINAIKGFRVETSHIPGMKRKYLVNNLGPSAIDYRFDLQDDQASTSRKISVQQYFREKYGKDLRYPHLPCLVVGQKKNHLPMEVCAMVASQKRKLTDQQTSEMIKKVTRGGAPKRQQDIETWADQLVESSQDYLHSQYGMSINRNMVDVGGRVLPPPTVTLGSSKNIQPRNGSWDMRGNRFFQGAEVYVWAAVCFADRCRDQDIYKFAQQMEKVCRQEGMVMSEEPCAIEYGTSSADVMPILRHLESKYADLQLVVIVLPPQNNKEIYKEIKRVGDTVLGIPTQCVQSKQFMEAKPQVCSNIAMKINAKLGGINHIINLEHMPPAFQNVIVFGADVTHPSPGENNIPSLAAVVASMDAYASRYAACVRAQTHLEDKSAQEIILGMAEMVRELLIEFYKKNNKKKPQRIIFYRDGVSEGQFDQVLLHEVRAVQQACLSLPPVGEYKPSITFTVVQKRHHARLFCADERDQSGKAGNIPPGTMVDRGITHPYEFDFYLCSHQGIQGTSRPTHYHVLYDDNGFDANSLHKLTYHLCHLYARCTKSVSMPAPAYYAHLVAFRARHHLNGMVESRNGQEKLTEQQLKDYCDAIKVNEKMKAGMYFA